MFRQSLSNYGLSLEQDTENVPADGAYYVLLNGKPKGRYRSLKLAMKRYEELKATLNIAPRPSPPPPPLEEVLRRELETRSNKSLIWDQQDFARVDKMTSRRGRVRR